MAPPVFPSPTISYGDLPIELRMMALGLLPVAAKAATQPLRNDPTIAVAIITASWLDPDTGSTSHVTTIEPGGQVEQMRKKGQRPRFLVDGAKIDFFFTPQRVRGMLRKAFKGNAKPPSLRVIELEHWARMLNAIRWMGRGWRGPWLDRGTHSEQTAQVMRALKDELPSELQPCIAAIDRHMAATKPHWMMGPPLQEWKDMALFLEGMLRSAGVTGNPSYRCIEYWVPYLTGERPTFGDIRAALIQRRFDRRPAKDLAAAVRWRELKRPKGKASGKR